MWDFGKLDFDSKNGFELVSLSTKMNQTIVFIIIRIKFSKIDKYNTGCQKTQMAIKKKL